MKSGGKTDGQRIKSQRRLVRPIPFGMNSDVEEEALCYQAKAGQQAYDEHRRMSRNCFQALEKKAFIEYVETHVKEEGWSLDACANRAILDGMFLRKETLCTKTLYNYVDRGFLEIIVNAESNFI